MKLFLISICITSCMYLIHGQTNAITDDERCDPPDVNVLRKMKPDEHLIPPSCGVTVPPCDRRTKFRRINASCNNLAYPQWGLPYSTYGRLLPAKYANGLNSPRRAIDNSSLPCTRRVRTSLFPIGTADSNLANINVVHWGQIVVHDLSLINTPEEEIPCCPKQGILDKTSSKYCYPIKIPEDDPVQGKAGVRCMNFMRTITDKDFGCISEDLPANQLTVVTPYLDLSNVYGNDDEEAHKLREFVGGRFKVEVRNNITFPPTEVAKSHVYCKCNSPNETTCYSTGDSRSNQNPELAILQIIFVREHNRLANALSALNPTWNDERLYQEARRINIAQYQHIVYYEWLPNLLSSSALVKSKIIFPGCTKFVNDYNASVNPGIANEFAQGALRHFHTQIVGMLKLMSPRRSVLGNVNIGEWINRPGILEKRSLIESFTIGLLSQATGHSDTLFDQQVYRKLQSEKLQSIMVERGTVPFHQQFFYLSKPYYIPNLYYYAYKVGWQTLTMAINSPTLMSDKLLACRNEGFGIDLKATDIQRDRDHGLASYNDYRKLFGMKVAKSFDDYKDLISEENIAKLKQLYKSHEDVDLSVGGSLEANSPGSLVGPTYTKILIEQFKRTRQSDRFWFENASSGLTSDQLAEIRKATVSRLFCDNGDGVTRVQPKGFNLISCKNALGACSALPTVNLTKWKV